MAASEKKLGSLHEHVAEALDEQVVGYDEPVLNAEGEEVGSKRVRPSPAVLSAAIAFLKNNNVTADAEDNEALRELGKALQARRKKSIPQAALDNAAMDFSRQYGGDVIQ